MDETIKEIILSEVTGAQKNKYGIYLSMCGYYLLSHS